MRTAGPLFPIFRLKPNCLSTRQCQNKLGCSQWRGEQYLKERAVETEKKIEQARKLRESFK